MILLEVCQRSRALNLATTSRREDEKELSLTMLSQHSRLISQAYRSHWNWPVLECQNATLWCFGQRRIFSSWWFPFSLVSSCLETFLGKHSSKVLYSLWTRRMLVRIPMLVRTAKLVLMMPTSISMWLHGLSTTSSTEKPLLTMCSTLAETREKASGKI